MQSFTTFWNIYIDNKLKDSIMKKILFFLATCCITITTAVPLKAMCILQITQV